MKRPAHPFESSTRILRRPWRRAQAAGALTSVLAVVLAVFLAAVLAVAPLAAELPEPDHTIYGTPRIDGVVAITGTVTLTVNGETAPIASYVLGSDPRLGTCDAAGCLFVLRVPMSFGLAGETRTPGTARAGDEASLFLDGLLAGRAVIGAAGTAQLLDVDTAFLPRIPGLSIADAAGAESLAGPFGLDVAVTLRLSFPVAKPVTVDWHTVDGTAKAGNDYAAAAGVATFAAGETVTTVSVTLFDDAVPEADPALRVAGESFFVQLANPTEASLLDAVGAVVIVDDDTPPALSIANLTVVEPPVGAVESAFRVSLSHPWDTAVSFDYSAVFGTAGAADFELAAGRATIPAGSLTAEIGVTVLADGEAESAETFEVRLANPVGASLRQGVGQGTILETSRLLTFVERERDGVAGVDGLFSAIDAALSPDGEHLYVAGRGDDALSVFARDPATGRLSFVTAYRDGEGGLEDLGGVEAVAVSPDGERVYAAAFDDNALSVFRREAADGTLTLIEVEREGARDLESGGTVAGLSGAIALAVVDDLAGGEDVYVAGSAGDALGVFHHDGGLLSFADVQRDGVLGAQGLDRAVALAASPDGAQLYVASFDDNAVAVFDRDPATGRLAFVEVHVDDAGSDGLAGASAVAVAPDGTSVYVAGQNDNALAVFDRLPDGTLIFRQAAANGAGGVAGLAFATDVAVSRDGRYVYATGFSSDALAVFDRAADGSLAPHEVELDGAAGIDGLNGATALAVSGDDGEVYATGALDDAVAVFRRDLVAPAGPDVFASTSHAVGVASTVQVIDLEWSGARDDETGSGVAGYYLLLDGAPDTVPVAGAPSVFTPHGLDAHTAASAPQGDGDRWAHLLTCDHAGNCAATHAGPFRVDTTPPSGTVAASTSHIPGVWSNVATIVVEWSQTTDASAVAGYSLLFDQAASTVPDGVVDRPQGADPQTAAAGPLADGDYYFHLRACDVVANCGAAIHLGPFRIDTVAPSPVAGLHSLSHPTGDTSVVQEITIAWDASTDAASGVAGYAVELDHDPGWTCDRVLDLAAGTTETTSPALADGIWYAHVCAGDEAGNWTAAVSAGPYLISTVPATVTLVTTVADTGDGTLAAGEGTSVPVTQLYLDFSRPMSDPAGDSATVDVTNPASYRLIAAGADRVFGTTGCAAVDPADQAISVDRVDYAATPRRADLWLHGGVPLPAGRYRLIGCVEGLHDEVDGPLDGDADGVGGEDFVLDFAVLVTDRLRNPNFDLGVEDWLLLSPQGEDVLRDDLDADGLATSGSARAAGIGLDAQAAFALAQCLPLEEREVAVGGRVRVDSTGPAHPMAAAQAEFFSAANCTGQIVGTASDSVSADTAGQWLSLEAGATASAQSASVLVSFVVIAQGAPDFEVRFDVLFFGLRSLIFADGFDSGNTSSWSAQVP